MLLMQIVGKFDDFVIYKHFYNDQFYYFYNTYSEKYDTNFVVTFEKKLFSISFSHFQLSSQHIYNNLDKAVNDKNFFALIRKDLSSYNCVFDKEYIISGHIPVFNISIVFDDDFNESYYNMLINFKHKFSQLEKNIDTSSIQIAIKFNDMNLSYNYVLYIYITDADTGEIENSNYETFIDKKSL